MKIFMKLGLIVIYLFFVKAVQSQGIKVEYISDIKLSGFFKGHVYELIGNNKYSVFRNQHRGSGLQQIESTSNSAVVYNANEYGWPIFKDKIKLECYELTMYKKLIIDSLHLIKWEVSHEKKQIAGIECIKALGSMGGREYTVWYAPSIPISDGPHKLNGLAGLILEARSTDGKVNYFFKSLTYLNELPDDTKNNLPYDIITIEEFIKIRNRHNENVAISFRSTPGVTYTFLKPDDYLEILKF
jgi:GLPGLI family protein